MSDVIGWAVSLAATALLWGLVVAPALHLLDSDSKTRAAVGMAWMFFGAVALWEYGLRDRVL